VRSTTQPPFYAAPTN